MQTTVAIADVTPSQLQRYAALVYEKIGVTIPAQKTTLLSNRLRRRLRATGIKSYDEYYAKLVSSSVTDPEWQAFLQEITTHETYLFRDEVHWKWFSDDFLRNVRDEGARGTRPKTLRIWSAACSTGDEAATIACCIAEVIPEAKEWRIEIVGTDIGAGSVAQAKAATFNERSMRNVSPARRTRFFTHTPDGRYQLKPELQRWQQFRVHNLLKPLGDRTFDVVFLKNVLIYFDKPSKRRVIEAMRGSMRPGTYLVTGAAEGVADLLGEFESLQAWLHVYGRTRRR